MHTKKLPPLFLQTPRFAFGVSSWRKADNARKHKSGARIITVMAGFPQIRMLAHDYRHNVAVNDVAYKYTNNEANRAFNASAATLMQEWAWQNRAEAKQYAAQIVPQCRALTENQNFFIHSQQPW